MTWDEDRARHDLNRAFDWADSVSEPGTWAWCHDHRRDLWADLDDSLDAINKAFQERDPAELATALRGFQRAVRFGVAAYAEGANPPERQEAGREYVEAKARTRARTASEPAGISC